MTADVLTPPSDTIDDGVLRWSVDQLYRMGESGVLDGPGQYELIDGTIYFMPPQTPSHYSTIQKVASALRDLIVRSDQAVSLREQGPLEFGDATYVEPDLAIVDGSPADYRTSHPMTALLVVEVSNTSYRKDSGVKLAVYAHAEIPEYWIVDVARRRVEVYRNPRPPEYAARITFSGDESFAPLFAPDAPLTASDLLT